MRKIERRSSAKTLGITLFCTLVFAGALAAIAPGANSGSPLASGPNIEGDGTGTEICAEEDLPTASFTISPNPALRNQTVTFNGSASQAGSGTITQYEWDLDGNGSFELAVTSSTRTRSYATIDNTILTKLRVTNSISAACVDTASHYLAIVNATPTSGFTISPPSPQTLESVTFTSTASDADGSGTIAAREWDLDNNTTYEATGMSPSRSFPVAGVYTIRHRVTDNDSGQSITTQSVTVSNRFPTANIGVNPPLGAPTLQNVTFNSNANDPESEALTYGWTFTGPHGFSETSTSQNPIRSFPRSGTYGISLFVTDPRGGQATDSDTVQITNQLPTASFTYGPGFPQAGASVTFDATGSDPEGTALTYTWDLDNDGVFGDAAGATASRSFEAGTRTVKLKATDEDSGSVESSQTLTISAAPAPPPPPPAPPPSPPAPQPQPQPQPQPRPQVVRCVVPNVKGKTLVQARRLLAAKRCALGRVSRAYSARAKLGRIISQSRRPGARFPRGTKVNVVLSRGRRR